MAEAGLGGEEVVRAGGREALPAQVDLHEDRLPASAAVSSRGHIWGQRNIAVLVAIRKDCLHTQNWKKIQSEDVLSFIVSRRLAWPLRKDDTCIPR